MTLGVRTKYSPMTVSQLATLFLQVPYTKAILNNPTDMQSIPFERNTGPSPGPEKSLLMGKGNISD